MTTKEIKELAQIAFDTYRGILDPVPLESLPEISQQDWINAVKVIKKEVEKKYAGCLIVGEPSTLEPEQADKETSIPCGYILLPKVGGSPLYIRVVDITAISGDPANKNMCWVYRGNDAFKCMLSAVTVGFMITEVIGANRRVNPAALASEIRIS